MRLNAFSLEKQIPRAVDLNRKLKAVVILLTEWKVGGVGCAFISVSTPQVCVRDREDLASRLWARHWIPSFEGQKDSVTMNPFFFNCCLCQQVRLCKGEPPVSKFCKPYLRTKTWSPYQPVFSHLTLYSRGWKNGNVKACSVHCSCICEKYGKAVEHCYI